MAGKATQAKPQTAPARPAAEGDDAVITALGLAPAALTPAIQAYFDKCMEKLGFVPNVLKAYAFDMPKLEAFIAMYNDLMLAPSGLTKLEREMIAVAVSAENRCYYCLTAHGAAVRETVRRPGAGRTHGDELSRRHSGSTAQAARDLDFAVKLTTAPQQASRTPTARLCAGCRLYRPRHLGHRGRGRLLQYVEPGRGGHRHAAEHRLPRADPGLVLVYFPAQNSTPLAFGENHPVGGKLQDRTELNLTSAAAVDSFFVNDSRADPPSAPEVDRQIADHRRAAAWLAVGAHGPTYQRLSEMRARRRPSGFRADGDLSWRAHASVQRAPRAGGGSAQLAEQLSGTEGGDRGRLRTQS